MRSSAKRSRRKSAPACATWRSRACAPSRPTGRNITTPPAPRSTSSCNTASATAFAITGPIRRSLRRRTSRSPTCASTRRPCRWSANICRSRSPRTAREAPRSTRSILSSPTSPRRSMPITEPATPMPDLLSVAPTPADGAECWTRREILQQAETLRATHALLTAQRGAIDAFLAPLLARANLRIVLTGAGTSAFIGECLAATLARATGRCVEAVATTEIVSAPDLYLNADTPTLLVSFGRSGNSPESVAAIELADARIEQVSHLVITCNADGELAGRAGEDAYVLTLPEATHDRGFAKTSRFSAMMYSALAIFSGIDVMRARIEPIAAAVERMLGEVEPRMAALAARGFSRVVFLGSGPFLGLAREAAL